MTLSFEVVLRPGLLEWSRLERVLELLVGNEGLFVASHLLDEADVTLDPDGLIGQLGRLFWDNNASLRIGGGVGENPPYAFVRCGRSDPSRGSIKGVLSGAEVEPLVACVGELATVVDSPFAFVDAASEPCEYRYGTAQFRAKQLIEGPIGLAWPRYLLSGIAFRTFPGRELVDAIGVARLVELERSDPHVVWRNGEQWVLSGVDDPEAFDRGRWVASERNAIELLGVSDLIVDPEAEQVLPTRWLDYGAPHFDVALQDDDRNYQTVSPDGTVSGFNVALFHPPADRGQDAADVAMPGPEVLTAISTWNRSRESYMRSREAELETGFVPQVILVRRDGDTTALTAVLVGPGIDYVLPVVDAVLATSSEDEPPRWIDWADMEPVLGRMAEVSAGHEFEWAGENLTCGLDHWTPTDAAMPHELTAALSTLGSHVPFQGVAT